MAFKDSTVAFIGSGVMAEAMIRGLLDKDLLTGDQIVAADPRRDRGLELVARYNLNYTPDNAEAARQADILVLSTKPQVMGQVAHSLAESTGKAALVLSILAGVRIQTIADGLGTTAVVRAMPNTPAQIGQGITVWTATESVPEKGREQARVLLGALGDEARHSWHAAQELLAAWLRWGA